MHFNVDFILIQLKHFHIFSHIWRKQKQNLIKRRIVKSIQSPLNRCSMTNRKWYQFKITDTFLVNSFFFSLFRSSFIFSTNSHSFKWPTNSPHTLKLFKFFSMRDRFINFNWYSFKWNELYFANDRKLQSMTITAKCNLSCGLCLYLSITTHNKNKNQEGNLKMRLRFCFVFFFLFLFI